MKISWETLHSYAVRGVGLRIHTHTDPHPVAKMRREEQVRAVIVNGLRAGMTAKEIIQYHKLANTTVYVVKRKFDEFLAAGGSPASFNINRKKHKRRSDCKSAAIAEDVRNIVSRDPSKSMRAIAVEMKVHERTIRRTMKEELRYKSYAMRKGQFMSEATKNRRLHKAKKLLARLKHPVAANWSSSQMKKTSPKTRN